MILKQEWKEGLSGIELEKRIEITGKERVWYWKNKGGKKKKGKKR